MVSVEKKDQILIKGLCFPEGPAFTSDGSLWCVELNGGNLVCLKNNFVKRFLVGGKPNGIAIDASDKIWFCDAGNNAIRVFDSNTNQTTVMASTVNEQELTAPNDLAFDKQGNLLFTCPGNSRQIPTGYICVLQTNGLVKKISTQKYFPNGLAFTKDGKSLIFAETYRHRLWKADWDDENCELINERVWCDIGGPSGPGGPDGMAFHPNGNLYVAVYGTQKVRVVNTKGEIIEDILLPGKNPTNCAFDFTSKDVQLVVTEAERGELLTIPVRI